MNEFHLIFASVNGNAESIAKNIADSCVETSLKCHLQCVDQFDKEWNLETCRCVVIIGATTGDGEPPDSARKFWRRLHKKGESADIWHHLSYTILGLGDTNYTNFCNFGKVVDQKLQARGANRFYNCGWADDGTGLEVVVEPWIEGLMMTLKNYFNCLPEVVHNSNEQDAADVILDTSTKCNLLGEFDQSIEPEGTVNPLHDINFKLKQTENITQKFNLDLYSQIEMNDLPVRHCIFDLDAKLSLPILPLSYLLVNFVNDNQLLDVQLASSTHLPSAASGLISARLLSVNQLTEGNALKTCLEVTLELPYDFKYEPGDSIGVMAKNSEAEVMLLLTLLNLHEKADVQLELSVNPDTKKRAAVIPNFLPTKGTLRQMLGTCLEIRSIPKKPFLRALVEFTSDQIEKRRLQELVSKEGADEYSKYIREGSLTLLDLLLVFPSCRPPITLLMEHLPRLLPRPYSIISSPLKDSRRLAFAFNVVQIPKSNSVMFSRRGICTGWFASMKNNLQELTLENLSLECKLVSVYLRTNTSFRLPVHPKTSLIMIGPGTGVAPFLGFLQHREQLNSSEGGVMWLFFGCQHRDQDFLYKDELERLCHNGILSHLCVSFSRDKEGVNVPVCDGSVIVPRFQDGVNAIRYVTDNLKCHGAAIVALIRDGASVYVCGDAKNMAPDVMSTFVQLLTLHGGLSEGEARGEIAEMQLQKRYLQDVWT